MEPELEDICRQFDLVKADAARLVHGLSDGQLTWRPREGAWSIIENIAHLNSVDGQDLGALFREIKLARKNGVTGSGPFKYHFLSKWFLRLLEPPVKMKVKAPKGYVPPAQPDPRETLLEYERIRNDLSYLAKEADGLHLARIMIPSPISRWIKLSLGQRLRLIAAHNRRHLWQAWNVRNEPTFPSS